jgi:hypothetical protein
MVYLHDANGRGRGNETCPVYSLIFIIHRPGTSSFEPVAADADGFQPSAVFGYRYRLDAIRNTDGNWRFDLREGV